MPECTNLLKDMAVVLSDLLSAVPVMTVFECQRWVSGSTLQIVQAHNLLDEVTLAPVTWMPDSADFSSH